MRTVFHQFFRPTPDTFERLWKEALIAYDASVLLNFYGYSDDARNDLIHLIRRYEDRTRLPHQFALEYARNRVATILKQVGNYSDTQRDFTNIESLRLQPKREHPFLSLESLRAFEFIRQELADRRAAIERMVDADEYMEVLVSVFEGRLGPAPTAEGLESLRMAGASRFAARMPPGYQDAKKKETDTRPTDPHGDYIAWKQLMDLAAIEKKDFILVVDDVKDDWWYIEGGKSGKHKKTIGPRPELLEEFRRETGQYIWLYTSEQFLRAAKQYDEAAIKDEVIEEVGAHLNAQKVAEAEQRSAPDGDESEADGEAILKQAPGGVKAQPLAEKVSRPEEAAKARQSDSGSGDDDE